MSSTVHITTTDEETVALGARLARQWPAPVTILLIGDLGAGKTTLAKGLASGFGASEDEVASPTFPLIHEYGEPTAVYHIDLYRLETAAEASTLGLDEIFSSRAAVLMEWAERFPALLPAERVEIRIAVLDDERRRVEVCERRPERSA